ncbi:MAG: hypothetical protein WC674_10395 [Candidatus Krumholzibacteriia bacterium]
MPRIYFRYDRRLLGDLCRVAAGVITESFHVLLGQPAAEPGLVIICPDCRDPMRIVAFIEEPRVVRAILEHLSLWDTPRPRPPLPADVGPADFEYVPCED